MSLKDTFIKIKALEKYAFEGLIKWGVNDMIHLFLEDNWPEDAPIPRWNIYDRITINDSRIFLECEHPFKDDPLHFSFPLVFLDGTVGQAIDQIKERRLKTQRKLEELKRKNKEKRELEDKEERYKLYLKLKEEFNEADKSEDNHT